MSTFSHTTVLLHEATQAVLGNGVAGVYVDGTFGRGGHSRVMAEALHARGDGSRLIGFDKDLAAQAAASDLTGRFGETFRWVHGSFAGAAQQVAPGTLAGALLDLGVSSPQIDEAARGFSFKKDGPLDMRMDTSQGETAAQFIARATTNELAEVIKNYGEERFAVPVAKALVAGRDKGIQLTTTAGLAAVVAQTLRACGARVERGQDPATRTFQALRIYVNRELEELQSGLDAMFGLLMPRARLAVISFHSLEDRIVKHFMRDKSTQAAPPKGVPVRADALPPAAARLVGKPIRPSEAEVAANPRARSAILRVLERAA